MHAVWWQCDLLETNGDWKRARQHSACWTSMRTPVQSQYICKTRVWWYTCNPTIGGEETRGSMNWLASLPESPHLNKESGDSLKKTPVVNLWPQQALPTHPPTHTSIPYGKLFAEGSVAGTHVEMRCNSKTMCIMDFLTTGLGNLN